MSKVVFVAPHPDDETLGCAGSILKHKSGGDKIYWVIATKVAVQYGWSASSVLRKTEEIRKVAKAYGFDKSFQFNYPAAKLDTIPLAQLISSFRDVFDEVKPEVLYLPNFSDVHTDHRIVFEAAFSCAKNFRTPSLKKILLYEVLSETEFGVAVRGEGFQPNVYTDISRFMERKLRIMKLYKSELMPQPFPRSIDTIAALGKVRGSRIAARYAESFEQVFEKR